MKENEARDWLVTALHVSRETIDRLNTYAGLVHAGQEKLNLVSAATLPIFWSRHIVDAAQLVTMASGRSWLDIGSGAGLPGLVTAILTGAETTLVESRPRRAEFLSRAVDALGLANVRIASCTMQKLVADPVDIITARAVAALPALVTLGSPFAHENTVWLLPKGKTAHSELASLPEAWQGEWEALPSITDPASRILIGRHVRMTSKR